MADSREPESAPRAARVPRWLGISVVAGSTVLLVGAGAAWRGWVWLQNNLTPWLETELSAAIQRPVELGDLERLTLSGVRVGPSQIPATATSPDFLTLQAVEVNLNPRDLLRREIHLDIILEQADLYLEQSAEGEWVTLDLDLPEPGEVERDPWITVEPNTIRLREGRLVMVPYDRRGANAGDVVRSPTDSAAGGNASPRIELKAVQGQVQFSRIPLAGEFSTATPPTAQQLDLDLSGTSAIGGQVDLKGAIQLPVAQVSDIEIEETGDEQTFDQSQRLGPAAIGQATAVDSSRGRSADTSTNSPTAAKYPTVGQWLRQTGRWLVQGMAPAWAETGDAPVAGQGLRANLNLRTQALQAVDIMPLIEAFLDEPLPVTFPTGTVSGAVDIVLGDEPPMFTGTARVESATVVPPGLPEPIQDLQGDVRLRGRVFEFENVTARLDQVTARAGGTLDLDSGYNLSGQINPFTIAQATELFEATLPVPAEGRFAADVAMTGPLTRPVITTEITSQSQVQIDRVDFAEVQAGATITNEAVVINQFQALPVAGGALTGSGRFSYGPPGQLALSVTGDRLPGDAIGRLYGLPETVSLGPVFIEGELAGPVDALAANATWRAPLGTYPARGSLAWSGNRVDFTDTFVQVAGGTVAGQGNLALDSRRWETRLRGTGLQLAQLGAGVDGVINGEAQFAGVLNDAVLGTMTGQGVAQAVLAGGVINGRGTLSQGNWAADVQGDGIQLAAFAPDLQGTGSGDFRFTGTTQDFSLAGIRGQGQLVLSDGLATAAAFAPQLATVREPLNADLAWNGQSILVSQASTAGLSANGTVTPLLGGGAPGIANVDLNLAGRNVSLAALPIPGQVVPVRGLGSFEGRLTGSPATLAFNGSARLDDLAVSDLAFATPLSGPIVFSRAEGFTVDLRDPSQRAEGDRLYASSRTSQYDLEFLVRSGEALAEGHTQGSDFYALITNLPLDDLRLPQGGVSGFGTLSGTIDTAAVRGNWREPTFQATFDIADPGLGYLTLQTVEDEAIANGDPNSQPLDPIAEVRYGRLRGTLGYANNILSLVGGRLESASGSSRYLLSGTYALDGSQRVNGELIVDNGQIQDILLTLKIFELSDFRRNLLLPPDWFRPLTEAELAALATRQVGDRNALFLDQLRRFAEVLELQDRLTAQADAAALPPLDGLRGSFSGTVTANGTLPREVRVDVDLAGRNWLWRDPSHPTGIGYRLDEIIAKGSYQDGLISLAPFSLRTAFPSEDPDNPTMALAELNGEFSLTEDESADRSLRLNVADVPLEAIRRPLRIPNNFDGFINGAATLNGSLNAPQVRGRLGINEATINERPIDLAAADFLYQNARLSLRSNVAIEDQVDPLTLVASVPLVIPGSAQRPEQDNVLVRLRVRDEGFALVNLFTEAITWESGQAALALNVDGNWPVDRPFEDALTSLVVTGNTTFEGVTISSRSLPEPLTNLRGSIVVLEGQGNGGNDSVYVNGLTLGFQEVQGDLSAGTVLAQGELKIVPSINDLFPGLLSAGSAEAEDETPVDNRFRLTLDNIALDLRNPAGTYMGKLDGEVVVGGSLYLLEPLVSGNLRLSNGVITLPDSGEDNGLGGGSGLGGFNGSTPSIYQPLPPVLEDFSVTLADNVRLTIPGIVNVNAEGTLALVGTVPDVKPDGRINLPSGRINLVTTEFRLTGNENYAEFSAQDERIDPYIVANLSAAVSDTAGSSTLLTTASPFPRNEVTDSTITQLGLTQNGIQTVRIRASVNGRASRLVQLQGVELESTPARSENEIIALISSEFITALESTLGSVSGGGDSFQGLLAFIGSALLNRLQGIVGAGLDNTELRLYSASPPGSQQIDVGGEVAFNLSPNLSISVQKVFTNITPALFGVRYRINDQFTIRGITSYEQFNENTGVILEFRGR